MPAIVDTMNRFRREVQSGEDAAVREMARRWLGNVLPTRTTGDTSNGTLGNAKLSGDFPSRYPLPIQFSYKNYIGFSQFGMWVGFARIATIAISALCKHILGIIRIGSQEKMIGIDTSSVSNVARGIVRVAIMKNVETIWNRANVKLPRYPVGRNVSAITILSLSVTVRSDRSFPEPTLIKSARGDVFPEAFFQRYAGFGSDVMSGDETNGLAFDVPQARMIAFRNRSGLSTTAFAKFDFLRGSLRGMIHDVVSASNAINYAGAIASNNCSGASISEMYYSMDGQI
jgi:hypothetical protein